MTMTLDDVFRVHLDTDGQIWFGRLGVSAVRAGLTLEEFLGHATFKTATTVRVRGDAQNARLIAGMHEHRSQRRRRPLSIQVVQPVGNLDTRLTLHQLWQPCLGPTRVHELTTHDYTSYALIAELQTQRDALSDKARLLLRYHPAYPALAFVPGLDWLLGAWTLAHIVDPRWFCHPDRPHRQTKLFRYMGVQPEAFTRFRSAGPLADSFRQTRSSVAWRAWHTEPPSSTETLANPGHFLWRIVKNSPCLRAGNLKATQTFLRFLSLVWQQSLATPGRLIFEPKMFFKSPAEQQAWAIHAEQKKRV